MMTVPPADREEYILLQLLYRAFLDIRLLAWEDQERASERIARICDLFHTLPSALAKARLRRGDRSSARLLEGLRERFVQFGAEDWLNSRIAEIDKELDELEESSND